MGTFRKEIGVAGLDGGNPAAVTALVDTGATHSMMPASLLRRLGVTPTRQRDFHDGRRQAGNL